MTENTYLLGGDGDPDGDSGGDPGTDIELLEKVLDAWVAHYLHPMMYQLTRTFAHHRKPETYGTVHVFEKFRHIAKDGGMLLTQIEAFKSMILDEWAHHPEGRIIEVARTPVND